MFRLWSYKRCLTLCGHYLVKHLDGCGQYLSRVYASLDDHVMPRVHVKIWYLAYIDTQLHLVMSYSPIDPLSSRLVWRKQPFAYVYYSFDFVGLLMFEGRICLEPEADARSYLWIKEWGIYGVSCIWDYKRCWTLSGQAPWWLRSRFKQGGYKPRWPLDKMCTCGIWHLAYINAQHHLVMSLVSNW